MARPPQTHPDDHEIGLYVRMPGWLKNKLVEQASAEGVSLTTFVNVTLNEAIKEKRGLPAVPQAVVPRPTTQDVLRSYLSGEPLLMPCGKSGSCEGSEKDPIVLGSVEYCAACDIRVN